MTPGGEHQQGSTIRVEHHRLDDLRDIDAELRGGLDRGAGGAVEDADLVAGTASGGQLGTDPDDGGVFGGHNR
jgi:hypothetical protein